MNGLDSLVLLTNKGSSFPPQYIALIVLVGVWLVILIVFGILSIKYQKKHNAYVKVRDEYEAKFHKLEKSANLDKLLLPIKTNIKLPKDEEFYDIEKQVACFIHEKKKHKSKKKKTQRMKRRELLEDYNDYYGIVKLKDIYGLNPKNHDSKFPDLFGDLYVTNKRVLVKSAKDIEEIKIKDITSCNQTVIFVDKQFMAGFAIVTDYDIYQFINEDPTVIIIIRELMKRIKEK